MPIVSISPDHPSWDAPPDGFGRSGGAFGISWARGQSAQGSSICPAIGQAAGAGPECGFPLASPVFLVVDVAGLVALVDGEAPLHE
jgi:hypothetical protein